MTSFESDARPCLQTHNVHTTRHTTCECIQCNHLYIPSTVVSVRCHRCRFTKHEITIITALYDYCRTSSPWKSLQWVHDGLEVKINRSQSDACFVSTSIVSAVTSSRPRDIGDWRKRAVSVRRNRQQRSASAMRIGILMFQIRKRSPVFTVMF